MTSIFVASSVEGQRYARMVSASISAQGAMALSWWDRAAFPVGATLIESLFHLLDRVDGAVIVMTPDDATTRRGTSAFQPSQNTLLEYGLFAGRLGRSRVAVLLVGEPDRPTDLDGVLHLTVPPLPDGDDADDYETVEIKPRIASWLEGLDASSSNGSRIAALLAKIAPGIDLAGRIQIKSKILCEQVNPEAFPRLTAESLEHLLLKQTVQGLAPTAVGYRRRTNVDTYLDLTSVPPESEDAKALAGHLARVVAELVAQRTIEPTVIAISKHAALSVVRTAAERLPFPIVLVDPYGPNPGSPIEGFFEVGDRAVLLHDVALSGHSLVECVVKLRSAGMRADDLVALSQHSGGSELRSLMRENRINLHCATLLLASKGRVACGYPCVSDSSPIAACLLCDVIAEKDTTPVRTLLDRQRLPSEILAGSDNFTVVCDVSPLARGHVLVLSKRHLLSLSKCNDAELAELDTLRRRVSGVLADAYGHPAIAFEHGLCNRARAASCGIDHAHLHVLPLTRSLTALTALFRQDFATSMLAGLPSLPKAASAGDEYLLLVDRNNTHHFALTGEPTRQYFRRMVAVLQGRDLWNWSDQILLGNHEETRTWILETHAAFAGPSGLAGRPG